MCFLKTLMPRKPLAELYTAIGYNKHGKTEFYRDFLRHLQGSQRHENEIFPEEFPRFLGFRPDLLETLIDYHGDLFQAVAWRHVQTALRAGNILDIFP